MYLEKLTPMSSILVERETKRPHKTPLRFSTHLSNQAQSTVEERLIYAPCLL